MAHTAAHALWCAPHGLRHRQEASTGVDPGPVERAVEVQQMVHGLHSHQTAVYSPSRATYGFRQRTVSHRVGPSVMHR